MKQYELYYYIHWPDSQKYAELDPEAEHTREVYFGDIVAEKSWVDSLNI